MKFMELVLFGALAIAVVATLFFVIAGAGKSKK
jgi:hypothetical protein